MGRQEEIAGFVGLVNRERPIQYADGVMRLVRWWAGVAGVASLLSIDSALEVFAGY